MCNNRIRLGILTMILAACMMIPMGSFANTLLDVDQDVNVNIHCVIDETDIPGMDFDIYYLADVDKYAEYTINEKFSAYEEIVDFTDLSGDNGDSISATLAGYVETDKIAPIYSSTTDEKGIASFAGKPGLYLILGHPVTIGTKTYETIPFMVFAPQVNEDNEWEYDITAIPKCKFTENPSGQDIKIIKAWNDEGMEDMRPSEVEVQLIKDQEVYESVKLNEANNWTYEWKDMDEDSEYQATETPMDKYTVEIAREDNTFIVTNTPIMIPNSVIPSQPDPKLPQTGLLWWPVFALAILGLGLLIIGFVRRSHDTY